MRSSVLLVWRWMRFAVVLLAGCGEFAESRVERPVHENAEDAARAQVKQLVGAGPEGMEELAQLLLHPDITPYHLHALDQATRYNSEIPGGDRLVEPLSLLAVDPSRFQETRIMAMAVLQNLGDRALPAAGRIATLLEDEAHGGSARWTLAKIGWPQIGEIFAQDLSRRSRYQQDALLLVDIVGPLARPAIPEIAKNLERRDDWMAWDAIRALAATRDPTAVEPLIRTLRHRRWTLAMEAVEALEWMRAKEAIPHLRFIASTHWRSELRKAAADSAELIEKDLPRPDPYALMAEEPVPDEVGCAGGYAHAVVAAGTRVPLRSHDRLEKPPPVGYRGPLPERPCSRVYERVSDGWIIGTNCGEFDGNGIAHVSEEGRVDDLGSDLAVYAFLRAGGHLFAIGTPMPMLREHGDLVEVSRSGGGWQARLFAAVVGAPRGWVIREDGILVAAQDGASLVRMDGSQHEVECVPGEAEPQ